MAEVITPEMFAPKASPKIKDSGFSLLTSFLCNLSRGRYTTHGCDSDHRVIIAFLNEIHDISADDSTDSGQ